MKTFLISLLVLLVLLISVRPMYLGDIVFIIIALILIYLPMIIIEAFVLRWLFTDFDTEDSVMASFLINFVSIVFFLFVTHAKIKGDLLSHLIDNGYGIRAVISLVVINIFIQLLVLKFEYKAVILIRGVIGIVFAHIVTIGVFQWWDSLVGPLPSYIF